MKIRLTIALVCLFMSFSVSGTCKLSVPANTVKLFGGLTSYLTIKQSDSIMSKRGKYRQLEGDVSYVSCIAQPVNRISYDDFRLFGFRGSLELVFYFGRLAETRFHPRESKDFFSHVADKGLPHAPGEGKPLGKHKVIWASGRGYEAETIGVEDKRIAGTLDDWVQARDESKGN